MNEILKRLRAGESADSIIQSITDDVNSALKAYEEEKKSKEEELAKKAKKDEIARQIYDLYCAYYDIDPIADFTSNDFAKILEGINIYFF